VTRKMRGMSIPMAPPASPKSLRPERRRSYNRNAPRGEQAGGFAPKRGTLLRGGSLDCARVRARHDRPRRRDSARTGPRDGAGHSQGSRPVDPFDHLGQDSENAHDLDGTVSRPAREGDGAGRGVEAEARQVGRARDDALVDLDPVFVEVSDERDGVALEERADLFPAETGLGQHDLIGRCRLGFLSRSRVHFLPHSKAFSAAGPDQRKVGTKVTSS